MRASPGAGRRLAKARERFLCTDEVEPAEVRPAILTSWSRSRDSLVAADRLDLQFVEHPDLDSPLARSAAPVLSELREQLDGQPLSIVLTDAAGVVLSQMTADKELQRHLDAVHLAPGFSYAETVVGTNGIGTALEAGRATHVFGHEHYAENLEALACAGVPIRHPTSGKTVGVLDLTCWRRDASPLLMTLAKSTAEQIRQALLVDAGQREVHLLTAYMRACRHSTGMVFALNDDVMMMNETARTTLGPGDQSALQRQVAEELAAGRELASVELPSGVRVRLHVRPVLDGDRRSGGVVDARVVEPAGGISSPPHAPRIPLPGLIGTAPVWRRACAEVEDVYRSRSWLVLTGEPGVGKLAVLRALHQRMNPGGRSVILEPGADADSAWLAQARASLAQADGTVILRHLERLPEPALRVLTSALAELAARGAAWAAVAVLSPEPEAASAGRPAAPSPELERLLRLFPSTVAVPPLRHHVEDVEELVRHLLLRLGDGGKLTWSPEARQMLLRSTWPGNVAQLLDTLRWVLRHRRSGLLQPADLPPGFQSMSRRRLSPLEAMERDAMVLALLDATGNKAQAARALGMSRATIYRKMHDYGIVGSGT